MRSRVVCPFEKIKRYKFTLEFLNKTGQSTVGVQKGYHHVQTHQIAQTANWAPFVHFRCFLDSIRT